MKFASPWTKLNKNKQVHSYNCILKVNITLVNKVQ